MEHFELITATGKWNAIKGERWWKVTFSHDEIAPIQKVPYWELFFLAHKPALEIMGIILKIEAAI